LPTVGEAHLVLGDEAEAFKAYLSFLAAGKDDPWMPSSAYLNARAIAKEYGDRRLARRLGEVFGDADP
jgi:hypothetical protein